MTTLQEARNRFDEFFEERAIPQDAHRLAIHTVEEATELLSHFSEGIKEDDAEATAIEALDVVMSALGVINALGVDIDLDTLFEAKIAGMEARYPLDKCQGVMSYRALKALSSK